MARLQCVKCKGKRDGAKCLKCGHIHGKKGGFRPNAKRPKVERLANPKLSEQILHDVRAYELEKACIAIEIKRLGINFQDKNWLDKVDARARTEPLFKMLDRLKCHARGNPPDTVNHLHDKPIEMNVNLNLAERIASARRRAAVGIDTDGKRSHKRP